MELERPSLDYRSYFEIPAFLFMTLSYCFFFSFYRVSTHNVAPTTWPAAWLVLVVVFFLNPLPILRRRSRYWLLKVLFRVCTPGYSRVEVSQSQTSDKLTLSSLPSLSLMSSTRSSSRSRTSSSSPVCTATTGQTTRTACVPVGARGRMRYSRVCRRLLVSSSV